MYNSTCITHHTPLFQEVSDFFVMTEKEGNIFLILVKVLIFLIYSYNTAHPPSASNRTPFGKYPFGLRVVRTNLACTCTNLACGPQGGTNKPGLHMPNQQFISSTLRGNVLKARQRL